MSYVAAISPLVDALPLDQIEDLRSRRELASLLQGADVGLALFDDQFDLVVCNPQYRKLMGFRDEEARVGAHLADLIMLSAGRETAARGGVKQSIDSAIDSLRAGRSQTVPHASPEGRPIEIVRRVIASGMIVETVRERLEAPRGATAVSFDHIAEAARAMMVHALDVMADGFALFDPMDRLIVFNSRYVEFHNVAPELVRAGMSYASLVSETVRRGGFDIGTASEAEFLAAHHARHRTSAAPTEIRRADGLWFQISERVMNDGCVVILVSDITRIKQRELDLVTLSNQLHARNTQFDAALNNMAQGLCLFDADARLLAANKRYLDMHGYSADVVKPGIRRQEIVRHSLELGRISQEEAERALGYIAETIREPKRFTIKQRYADGRVIAIMSEPMANGGAVATYTDVTESERHALELREYTLKLERSNRDLEEFAYVASHDLQEPLRKIEAFGDRLAKRYGPTLPEDGQMFIDRMQNAAGRMRRLIGDLLSYSRVMTKANPRREISLDAVLADVLGDLQVRIDEVGAEIRVASLPSIDADPVQMGQLFQNLLSNALKFVRPGVPPVIDITAEVVQSVGAVDTPLRAYVITIRDNGIGFDNKYKEQIFKIFQRLHGRMEYEGTGVGLATVRKIVERHHGAIDCDGRPGEGATFIVTLPIGVPASERADAA